MSFLNAFVVTALMLAGSPALADLPAALLGPDGPTWVGPFPPRDGGSTELVVDPLSGDLWLSQLDAPGSRRIWAGWGWTVGGEPLDASSPPENGARYEFMAGRLVAVETLGGARQRFRYDAAGRVIGVIEVGGGSVDLRYDEQGRISSIAGPGRALWRLAWGERLAVTDGLGRPLTVTQVGRSGRGEGVQVRDATGRSVTTLLGGDGPSKGEVIGWQTPRGLVTRVREIDGGLELIGPTGDTWRLALDGAGRVIGVRDPSGQRWQWKRDADGRLISATDPAGRSRRWERDEAGRVVALVQGGESTRLLRDADGNVVEIIDGTGGRTRLLRDRGGRVSDIIDAVGNVLAISRDAAGVPTTVVERSGARWILDLDLLGRVARVVDPTRRELTVDRDRSGALVTLQDSVYGTIGVDRGGRGSVTRLIDAAGRSTGFLRDAADRVVAVVRADGSEVRLTRDAAGDVVLVGVGESELEVARDAAGRPLAAGDVRWRRDVAGRVSAVEAPGIELALGRDGAGQLVRLRALRWSLAIERDRAGRPVHWSGTDGDLVISRDGAGRRVGEEGPQVVSVRREPRGLVESITCERGTWRWMRDATGRPLQVSGPDGLTVGVNRDDAGRASLVRHTNGALSRRSWEDSTVSESVEDADGNALYAATTETDRAGRTAWTERVGVPRSSWHYGPLGQLVAIESEQGAVWSWTMDVVAGPEGEVMVLDRDGRLAEARPPVGPAAWGVARAALSVFRDRFGRVERLVGDLGTAEVRYDSLGRLSAVRGGAVGDWVAGYDPLGRLSWVHRADIGTETLLWGPDAIAGDVVLAAGVDLSRAWVYGPSGPAAWSEHGQVGTLIEDAGGAPRRILVEGQPPTSVRRTPQGWIDPWLGPVSIGGTVQAWAGGPLLRGREAIDPVSGQRIDGWTSWPWEETPVDALSASDRLDPALWAPESPWHDPLALVVALGVVPPMDEHDGPWAVPMPTDPRDRAAPWLPRSLDDALPPMGPVPGWLPIDEDPITNALVSALLPGGSPPDPGLVGRVLLEKELLLPRLPPDLSVPGSEALR